MESEGGILDCLIYQLSLGVGKHLISFYLFYESLHASSIRPHYSVFQMTTYCNHSLLHAHKVKQAIQVIV